MITIPVEGLGSTARGATRGKMGRSAGRPGFNNNNNNTTSNSTTISTIISTIIGTTIIEQQCYNHSTVTNDDNNNNNHINTTTTTTTTNNNTIINDSSPSNPTRRHPTDCHALFSGRRTSMLAIATGHKNPLLLVYYSISYYCILNYIILD